VGRRRRLSHALSPSVFPARVVLRGVRPERRHLTALSKNNVELMEEAETCLLPKDMSLLHVEADQSPRIITPTQPLKPGSGIEALGIRRGGNVLGEVEESRGGDIE
jgi:hypothetical protein